ncbi:MAG: hypothetical protein A3H06_01750 [Candidatus Colwellbacteria bacterium RIFCSPLOWO2_12_FULL_44_13]|uniref:Cohesin domain-containing protein n=3 Tax=Candidatus Colwelliibacteriota TaxID=1817904 RepID=A0A1G1Z875_9BACT|nr:MAG: hypothetical protein A3F24_00370 [Candidatus Colwellbacteria bacterium RIFCSPHIGHO2_12_FULL_44_17]OGY60629.1 MAG: hypothetical protein A3I31_00925 [Candidatus Colwellbacteria bacterium RIFCSPLOWO2_02_FULL_44_20b]OGY61893.1 MAG: hypothetical protein A3H06_01750 [Candidatus Colwellbacteria bacterium RIFCSPLOWO2_12_FULL_44_13]
MTKIYKIALILLCLGVIPKTAEAAALYFSPSSGTQVINSTFSVNVYVSSADKAMNAASGTVSFPPDKLEVASLSKNSSIMTLWVQEPSFSNSAGTINFEGIVLNPGFTGASGKVITVNFKAKTTGTAVLTFSSGSVLANDGKGTNILEDLANASFSLGNIMPTVPEATTPSETAGTPAPPPISSPTHPDPNKWYALNDAKFTWLVPSDVTAARLLVGKIPQAVPTVYYEPAISSKGISDLEGGDWYFHVRLKNKAGWGGISHFRFRIDTESPEPFLIQFVDGEETTNPRPTALFETTDSLSGIDYYKVKVGEGDFLAIAPEILKHNPFTLPLQTPGKKTIFVQAFDKAGNYTSSAEEFVIKTLEPPTITEYPKQLPTGETLIVKGKTQYPNAQTVIWFASEGEEPKNQTVRNDENGNFTLVAEEDLDDGVYKLWAEITDERGAKSAPSEEATISVEQPAFLKLGSWAVNLLAVIIPLVVLVTALLAFVYYSWHKFSALRNRLRKETREAESALHKAFNLLRDNIRDQIKMLEKAEVKRQLTKEEERIIKRLKKDLDNAEKFVGKEIGDIEKEVK